MNKQERNLEKILAFLDKKYGAIEDCKDHHREIEQDAMKVFWDINEEVEHHDINFQDLALDLVTHTKFRACTLPVPTRNEFIDGKTDVERVFALLVLEGYERFIQRRHLDTMGRISHAIGLVCFKPEPVEEMLKRAGLKGDDD